MSAYTDAQAQNDITRNVRKYKDLDLQKQLRPFSLFDPYKIDIQFYLLSF